MGDFGIVVRASLSAAVVSGMLCAGAQAALPQGQYSCQVITKDGGPGLVQVQVDSREEAIAVARRSKARTIDGVMKSTAEVVQCIRWPDERFTDKAFQALYESMPR